MCVNGGRWGLSMAPSSSADHRKCWTGREAVTGADGGVGLRGRRWKTDCALSPCPPLPRPAPTAPSSLRRTGNKSRLTVGRRSAIAVALALPQTVGKVPSVGGRGRSVGWGGTHERRKQRSEGKRKLALPTRTPALSRNPRLLPCAVPPPPTFRPSSSSKDSQVSGGYPGRKGPVSLMFAPAPVQTVV